MPLFDLTGKVALVTGATKGIGRGIAGQLAAHGARVIVSSRDRLEAEQTAAQLNQEHGGTDRVAHAVACDINNLDEIEKLARAACGVWDGIDVLVCNAAVLAFIGDSRDTPPELFNQLLATNIHHNFRLCQAVRSEMAKRGGGAIILIGSVSGHTASPSTLAYGVSKAGMAHMARSLADEMAPQRIRVNCIAPGLIRSFASGKVWRDPERLKVAEATIPLGRIGEPEDIAGAVVFLASNAGSYVTGTTLHVDGGRSFLSPPGRSHHLSGMSDSKK
jgi:hypothetical protein